jgi:hypothetical protein
MNHTLKGLNKETNVKHKIYTPQLEVRKESISKAGEIHAIMG